MLSLLFKINVKWTIYCPKARVMNKKAILIFIGLVAGNFISVHLFDLKIETFVERSFFQGIAIFCYWLSIKNGDDNA